MERKTKFNSLKQYRKILVIGCPGSGKSTLSSKIANKYNLALIHLDKIFWKENWEQISKQEFDEKLIIELNKDNWIIDGNYKRTIPLRIKYCDLIIYLDLDSNTCLNSYYRRVETNEIQEKGYITKGCVEQIDDEFVEYIKSFNDNFKKELYDLVYNSKKDYIIFNTREEVEKFISKED